MWHGTSNANGHGMPCDEGFSIRAASTDTVGRIPPTCRHLMLRVSSEEVYYGLPTRTAPDSPGPYLPDRHRAQARASAKFKRREPERSLLSQLLLARLAPAPSSGRRQFPGWPVPD